jgi:hypothetical protein
MLRGGMDVRHHNGEVTSFPAFRLEALPDGQRIIPEQIVTRFNRNGYAIAEGSTEACVRQIGHAGICVVKRYSFELP